MAIIKARTTLGRIILLRNCTCPSYEAHDRNCPQYIDLTSRLGHEPRSDKARLDWLAKNKIDISYDKYGDNEGCLVSTVWGKSLRKTIDPAMDAEAKK